VQPDQRVLIIGAGGGAGSFAVQIAKAYGAQVTGVCSTAKLDFVRSAGADHVIDYTAVDYTRTGERYDWIVDVDSHHSVLHARPALRPGGVYVTLGGGGVAIGDALIVGSLVTAATNRRMGLMLGWKPFAHDDVEALKGLISAGRIRPFIDRRYPLDGIVEALRDVDEGRPAGKVVIQIS
jgi:NADPH:quinone reductase-like Zn-dependent oxidoreductase